MLALQILLSTQGALFVERDGIVSIEAERAGSAKGWIEVNGKSGKALQDDGQGTLAYDIRFSRGGKFYVWLLCRDQGDTKTNDCFVTLGGERLYAADDRTRPDGIRCAGADFKRTCRPKGPGGRTPDALKNKHVYALVPGPGRDPLRITHRSKGFVIDKIVLALDGTTAPEGNGPQKPSGNPPIANNIKKKRQFIPTEPGPVNRTESAVTHVALERRMSIPELLTQPLS